MPGSNVIEAQFDNAPADWEQTLIRLSGVTSVKHEGAGMYRILTGDGSRTTTELVETGGTCWRRGEVALRAEYDPG